MSAAARSLAFILVLAIAVPVLSAATAFAQCGVPNPSGGTSLRPATQDDGGSLGRDRYVTRGLSIDLALRMWIQSALAARMVESPVSRAGLSRTMAASAPRRVGRF